MATNDATVAPPPRVSIRLPFGGELLARGVVTLWLTVIVLIPLAAVLEHSLQDGLGEFWEAITEPESIAAIRLTLISSLIVVAVNATMGTLIAWVLVRDDFRGKGIVNSLIDLPFALPTIVAGLTLLALYGPKSPIGANVAYTKVAIGLALLFVTLPFEVRAVQPVLIEVDREMEEAAASLGASRSRIFRSILIPNLTPAIVAGCALAVEPEVLLLDEPFGALDATVRKELRTWLRRLHEDVHVTTIFVTHDQEEAMDVAEQIVVMNDGRIEQVGTPRDLYEQPSNEFVMGFVGEVNRLGDDLVRPHDIQILLEPDGTTQEGQIERVAHLGFEVRVELVLDDGRRLAVQTTRQDAEERELETGQIVYLRPDRERRFAGA